MLLINLVLLAVTAVFQGVVVVFTGSVALLGDTLRAKVDVTVSPSTPAPTTPNKGPKQGQIFLP